jgi:hypothetical protein
MDGYGSGYGSSGYGVPGSGGAAGGYDAEPSQQIMVRNVSGFDIVVWTGLFICISAPLVYRK